MSAADTMGPHRPQPINRGVITSLMESMMGPATAHELMDELELWVNSDAVDNVLDGLQQQGVVVELDDGRWELVAVQVARRVGPVLEAQGPSTFGELRAALGPSVDGDRLGRALSLMERSNQVMRLQTAGEPDRWDVAR